MTTRWIRRFLPAALILTAGCTHQGTLPSLPLSSSLLPDYQTALAGQPGDVTVFFRDWLGSLEPTEDENGRIAYAVEGRQGDVTRSLERLLSGYEAYCGLRAGNLDEPSDAPGRRCVTASGETLARLEVDVVHAAEFQPARLRFAAETSERVQHNETQRRAQYDRIEQLLGSNGPAGNVLLANGEAFEAARFGRLSGPDYYAVQLPGREPIAFADMLSVRWADDSVRIVLRDGSVVTEAGKGLGPERTLVRLVPTDNESVEMDVMSYDAPFRFVALDARTRQPRQVRVRDTAKLLEITISARPPALRAGPLPVRPDAKEQAAFNKRLVKDATRASKNLKPAPEPIDLADARVREEVERMGRKGPCGRSQSDAALRNGDLSLSEFYVCAQYRKEARLLLENDGAISPDSTPLVYLGRAARAPWFDFGGVLR
jgi:hypothetical protein